VKAGPDILLGTGLTAGAVMLAANVVAERSEGSSPDAKLLTEGRAINDPERAACHGAELEGRPDWRSPLPIRRLPASRRDASGHTWHPPDEVLFRVVKEGTAAIVGGGYESDMPGFGDVLSDAEIRAILEYIKSAWPARERQYQGERSASGDG
jgi:hypothetical protein